MSEHNPTSSNDPVNADIQKALLAAFGDEAADWLEDDAQEEASLAQQLDGTTQNKPASQAAGLEDLLNEISSAINDDGASAVDSVTERASVSEEEDTQQDAGPRHVVFTVGNQRFGIPLTGVHEIDRCGKVTTLPRTPAWLRGVTNLRGQILSVTDFRNLLEMTDDRQTVGEKIIVVHSERHDARTALVVDRVLGIRNLSGERGPLEGLSDRVANFADSLAVADQATTVLIDPDSLLGCDELMAFAKE